MSKQGAGDDVPVLGSNGTQALERPGMAVIVPRPLPTATQSVLVPPLNFAMVAPGVYRSGYPGKRNEQFLVKLGLRSIICLSDEPYRNADFVVAQEIQLFQFPIIGNKEPFVAISEDIVAEAIGVILDRRNHPILIHCNKGKHRVGCIVGCLRKVQNWSVTFIFDEYQRYAGTKVRIMDQQYIELFDTKRVVYDKRYLPSWLW